MRATTPPRVVGALSPGLIVRLALLLLTLRRVNVLFLGQKRVLCSTMENFKLTALIIDEVTNFIDRSAKEVILEWIGQFKGGVVCVTHDRELIESVDWDRIVVLASNASSFETLDRSALTDQLTTAKQQADEAMTILFE